MTAARAIAASAAGPVPAQTRLGTARAGAGPAVTVVGVTAAAPNENSPNPHFERIGGESAIARLTDAFYRAMDSLPQAEAIRRLHPADLSASRDKLFAYLVGWMGGPPLYVEKRGHPRLRQRHLPFPIGETERDAWLQCMDVALEQVVEDPALRLELRRSFARIASSLRNL
jgi:hemoglobin